MHEWLTATVYIEIVEGVTLELMHEWLTATVYVEIVEGETLEQCTSG